MSKCRENIRHLIPRPKTPAMKPPMYRSVHTESVKRTYAENKGCHRTMGYAEVEVDPPSKFLKKHSRKAKPVVSESIRLQYDQDPG